MESKKKMYKYAGAVYCFENLICRYWEGKTWAVSENKARCNLTFQYKRENNYVPGAKITLPDAVICVG